jgi:arylsulfatase A-like enzyme
MGIPIFGDHVAHDHTCGRTAKPNIVFNMGNDVGWFNIGAYKRGMMAGRTPNLDQLAAEGMMFTAYYAEASCTPAAPISLLVSCRYVPA